jgi:hypothetical protein
LWAKTQSATRVPGAPHPADSVAAYNPTEYLPFCTGGSVTWHGVTRPWSSTTAPTNFEVTGAPSSVASPRTTTRAACAGGRVARVVDVDAAVELGLSLLEHALAASAVRLAMHASLSANWRE